MKLISITLSAFIIYLTMSALPSTVYADNEAEKTLKAVDRSIRLREYGQAVTLLKPLLNKNNAEAQYRMAGLYRSGSGVKKDMEKAMSNYTKASQNGLADAQFALASLLEKRGTSSQKLIDIQKWYQAAADQGHRKAIQKLASLENKIAESNTPEISREKLFGAIRNNALDKIKALIERNINLDISDRKKRTPLMVSLLAGHREMSRLILDNTGLQDKPDMNGDRPLHIATSRGYSEIVKQLIRNGSKINSTDGLGNTALIIATRHDDKAIIEFLLSNNADHSIINKKNQSAPQLAQALNLKQAKLLFQKHNISLPEKNKDYATLDINSFQASISKSASLYKDWPLINIASVLGEAKIVEQLLDQGAKINATDPAGNTALHRAVSKGQLKIVRLLLSGGSNINAANQKLETPIYLAASSGQLKTIKYLLDQGADSSLIAKNKTSPLSVAISKKQEPSAMLLATAKLDEQSIHRALLLAIQNRMEKLALRLIKRDKLLVFSYANNRSALWHSANSGLVNATSKLLKRNIIDINLADKSGYTALAQAVNNGFEKTASLLIKNGADIKTLTNENNTILMLAVISGKPVLFKKMLKLEKNLDAKNKAGDTALMLAAAGGKIEFVELLIKSGADIQTRNQDDLNAYQIAINSGHDATASLIRESSGKLFKLFN